MKIGTDVALRLLILVPTLVLWISKPKSIFGQICTQNLKVVQFGWKLAYRASQQFWFLFQHYFSQFPILNTFLDKFGLKKFKVVHFDWKLAHMVYRGCWFLFPQYFSELPTLNPFLGKFRLKKSKLFLLSENWHIRTYTHSILKMLILISILSFLKFQT